MFNSFYVVSLFSFPDQLMAKCFARLPLRNHVLWQAGQKHYEENFIPMSFKRNTAEFHECIAWCFKQEMLYRKRVKDPRFAF
jgi:hypothetical protein